MKQSEVVIALASMASQGKYTVDRQGSKNMNALFDEVARVINELEESEKGDSNDEDS